MSEFQDIVKQAAESDDIDLMLPKLLETKFYVVCGKDEGDEDGQDVILVESEDSEELCITAAEDVSLLAPIKEMDPDLEFVEMQGDELLGMVRDEHEIIIYFDDGAYLISRDQIEWWYEELHDDEDEEGDDDAAEDDADEDDNA
ncbi:MAG TPA: hypothetical protein VGD95_04660 [Micavibrio sp.]